VPNGLLVVGWVLSRGLLVWLLVGPQRWVAGDAAYYAANLAEAGTAGLGGTLAEYPLPAVAVVAVPWLIAHALGVGYAEVLIGMAALTDLAFTLVLARLDRRRWATAGWVLAVPLLGTTAYARFDLLPSVLCGLAVLALARRPGLAAACAAIATAVKLWPALLLPPLLAGARSRGHAALAVATVGTGAVLATTVLAGWDRVVSPLAYQADRGLQVEAVLATPVMAGWVVAPDRWRIWFAPSSSYEISGPGVDWLLLLSAGLTIGYVVALAAGWWVLWRSRDAVGAVTVVWAVLAAVTGFMVVGKVLSPQYLLWLMPAALAGLAVTGDRGLRRWAAVLLVAAGLTQVVFPATYEAITFPTDLAWFTVLVLAVRNLVMVWLLVEAVRRCVAGLVADRQRGSALDRQPPGPDGNVLRTSR
jgi:hypothetical protein